MFYQEWTSATYTYQKRLLTERLYQVYQEYLFINVLSFVINGNIRCNENLIKMYDYSTLITKLVILFYGCSFVNTSFIKLLFLTF